MLNANAQKWVEALESGEFTQGQSRLCTNDTNYCCLGVACEVYNRENPGEKLMKQLDDKFPWITTYDGNAHGLPIKVQKWLGVINSSASFKDGYRVEDYDTLIGLNDCGEYKFPQIAQVIRDSAKHLFVAAGPEEPAS